MAGASVQQGWTGLTVETAAKSGWVWGGQVPLPPPILPEGFEMGPLTPTPLGKHTLSLAPAPPPGTGQRGTYFL